MRIGLRFYLIFLLTAFLIFPVHELAHYVTYRLSGVQLQMTLNTASPQDQSLRRPLPEIAGPLLNLALAVAALCAFCNDEPRKIYWAALALAAALMRLALYILILAAALVSRSGLSLGNDEPIAAHLWGLPSLTFVALFSVPLLLIVWSVVRTFQCSRTRTWLHVFGFSLLLISIGALIGNVLDPWLFPTRFR